MQTVKKILDLPISGSGCLWARFVYNDTDGTLEFSYSDRQTGEPCIGTLFFPHVMSFRFWDEMHAPAYFWSEAYDSVAEGFDSEWLAGMEKTEPKGILKLWRRRHFAVLLSSNGYFELIADDCKFSSRSE
jgi:hypothetical protein